MQREPPPDSSLPVPELPLTGGCNCGAVRFEISEPLLVAWSGFPGARTVDPMEMASI
jgi:hypothetical protein